MTIAIMGAGGVGSDNRAMLARARHGVTLIARPPHVQAIARHGLVFEARGTTETLPVTATTEPSGVAGAEVVLFCVKSGDTQEAGRAIAPHLAANATILSLQNGVDNAQRLQEVLGRPVIPAAVYVAVEMPGPGHVRHHGRGELVIGPGATSAAIATSFGQAGIPTEVSENVIGALWTKLVVNCAYNALSAIPQLPYGRMIAVEGVRDSMADIVAECRAVAQAAGQVPSVAGIYTCTDGQGRKLTSDRPIAECVSREQRQLNRDGSLRRTVPPTLTPEERAALREKLPAR